MTDNDEVECPECRGTKKAAVAYDIKPGKMPEDQPAPDCPTCGGTGRIKKLNSN
jgi:predicted nucleic acid-binding Zn ribbon protein